MTCLRWQPGCRITEDWPHGASWCSKVGRDPSEIERTVSIGPDDAHSAQDYLDAGATHIIVSMHHPFDMSPLQRRLDERDAIG